MPPHHRTARTMAIAAAALEMGSAAVSA